MNEAGFPCSTPPLLRTIANPDPQRALNPLINLTREAEFAHHKPLLISAPGKL